MEGLNDHLQYALLNFRFTDFNHLVDSALNTERKRREIEERKRKLAPAAPGSNTRPCFHPVRCSSNSRRYRVRGFQHLRHAQLHQHLRLHGWQLLLPIRRQPHECATTVAIRGTTPALAPGRRSQDSRGVQLSPGRHCRAK
jgi:hypothetical protein